MDTFDKLARKVFHILDIGDKFQWADDADYSAVLLVVGKDDTHIHYAYPEEDPANGVYVMSFETVENYLRLDKIRWVE